MAGESRLGMETRQVYSLTRKQKKKTCLSSERDLWLYAMIFVFKFCRLVLSNDEGVRLCDRLLCSWFSDVLVFLPVNGANIGAVSAGVLHPPHEKPHSTINKYNITKGQRYHRGVPPPRPSVRPMVMRLWPCLIMSAPPPPARPSRHRWYARVCVAVRLRPCMT